MDQVLSKEDKKRIYDLLAEAYINHLRSGYLGTVERKVISQKILDNIGKSSSLKEVNTFLESLSGKYSFFKPAVTIINSANHQDKETEIINKLQQYIGNLKTN